MGLSREMNLLESLDLELEPVPVPVDLSGLLVKVTGFTLDTLTPLSLGESLAPVRESIVVTLPRCCLGESNLPPLCAASAPEESTCKYKR